MNYQKGDCRAHGPLTSRPLTMDFIVEKAGTNRHDRRRMKALTRERLRRGVPKLVRRMVRAQGLRETIMMMHGRGK